MVQSIIVIAVIVLLVCLRVNRAKIIGKSGERKVSTLLRFLNSKYMVFNDVLIRNGQWTSQIDHIVVSQYGIFVIETKNYNGWIYGGVNQEQWTQNIWGHKNHLQNPIRQNNGHIIALKKILPEYAYNQYRSIIVFTSRSSLRSRIPDYFNVIHTRQLLRRIKSYKELILTAAEVDGITRILKQHLLTDRKDRKRHVSNVRNNVRKKEQLTNAGRCPRCGGSLVKRNGKYGSFYGCSNYPNCKYTCK